MNKHSGEGGAKLGYINIHNYVLAGSLDGQLGEVIYRAYLTRRSTRDLHINGIMS